MSAVETIPASQHPPKFVRHPSNPPVLILGWIPRIVVPIARSLHAIGVPVDVASAAWSEKEDCPRTYSRAIRSWLQLPNPLSDSSGFISRLTAFITERGHDMLIPTDDQFLITLEQHYDHLSKLLQIAAPPPHVLRSVLDKSLTLDVARRCGIRIPKTIVVRDSGELLQAVETISFPTVLKPAEKMQYVEESKSERFNSPDEIRHKFGTACAFACPMLLQEYCPGAGVGVEILLHNTECVAVFQHRRLKELPFTGGFSTVAVSEKPDPALVESSLRLLRALKWEGPAMVEYKVPQEGDPVLMEVNGRYWGTISLPIMAGVDFPRYYYQLAHGVVPHVNNEYPAGMKWRWTVGYIARLHGLLAAASQSESARKLLSLAVCQVLEDFGPSTRDAIFTFSDPLPAIVELLRNIKYFAGYDVKALLKRISNSKSLPSLAASGSRH